MTGSDFLLTFPTTECSFIEFQSGRLSSAPDKFPQEQTSPALGFSLSFHHMTLFVLIGETLLEKQNTKLDLRGK